MHLVSSTWTVSTAEGGKTDSAHVQRVGEVDSDEGGRRERKVSEGSVVAHCCQTRSVATSDQIAKQAWLLKAAPTGAAVTTGGVGNGVGMGAVAAGATVARAWAALRVESVVRSSWNAPAISGLESARSVHAVRFPYAAWMSAAVTPGNAAARSRRKAISN